MNVAVMVMAEVPLGVPGTPEFFVDLPLPQSKRGDKRGDWTVRCAQIDLAEISSQPKCMPKV
jgi:hypothetical protein